MPRSPLRLERRAQFLAVARAGRKLSLEGFALQALAREDGGPVRVGFTATRKLGNAVARNRTRRRLREATRLVLAGRPLFGFDLVLIGRPATRTLPFAELRAEFASALDRLERIALDWNRGAIPREPCERVDPLAQTKQSVFSRTENALARSAREPS